MADSPDLTALLKGMTSGPALGRLALGGSPPSIGSPRGSGPPIDPLTGNFRQCISMLNGLQQTLQRQGDQPRSIDVGEMSIKLQRLSVDRMKDIADAGSPAGQAINSNANPAQFPPNVNGGGTV